MSDPLVTVVLPTYKRSDFLERSIQSVLDQSYGSWELVVVDDNDPDSSFRQHTEAFMRRYDSDERIRYLKHRQNRGGSAARNTGIREARGEFVAFLDDDDAWDERKLEKQMALMTSVAEETALVYCGFHKVFLEDGTSKTVLPSRERHQLAQLLRVNGIGTTSTVLCRRDVLLEVGGFDESLPSRQDIDLYVRVARRYRLDYVAEPLVTWYRHRAESIGTNRTRMIAAHRAFLAKHREDLLRHPEAHSRRLVALGELLLAEARLAEAWSAFAEAWRVRPVSFDALLYLPLSTPVGFPLYRAALYLKARRRSVSPAAAEGAYRSI